MKWWTDKLLAKRIVAGDRRAYEKFVKRYQAKIFRLLVRLCRDADLAEDLTQETFAAAWANIATYAGASSLSTWLHRIAYRKFLDRRRRPHSRSSTEEFDLAQIAASTLDPVEAAVRDEECCLLHAALLRLPPSERHLLVLHYLQGLSYREMAEVTAEPCGTVKWRTSLALKNLRAILEVPCHVPKQPADAIRKSRTIHREPFTSVAATAAAGAP